MIGTNFKEEKNKYIEELYSLTNEEIEAFINPLLDSTNKIVINPKDENELTLAQAYLSIFKDEISFVEIFLENPEESRKLVKPEENEALTILIKMLYEKIKNSFTKTTKQEMLEQYLPFSNKNIYELVGRIKAHSAFVQVYEEELESYLKSKTSAFMKTEDILVLLLECQGKMIEMLEIPSDNAENASAYAKGYHDAVTEYKKKLNSKTLYTK